MIKNIFLLVFASFIVSLATSCSPKPNYDDVKAALDKKITTLSAFVSGVASAPNSSTLSIVMENFLLTYKADMEAFQKVTAANAENFTKDIPIELQDSFSKLAGAKENARDTIIQIQKGPYARMKRVDDNMTNLQVFQMELSR